MSSRRITAISSLTPVSTADTTNLANATYLHCLQPAASTQTALVWEISISGQAASTSSPTFLLLSFDSTVGTGAQTQGTVGTDTNINPVYTVSGTAVGSGNVFATTLPQRSATQHLMNCSLNAFGGVYFWRANRMEECPSALGTTQPYGSISLSATNAGTPSAGPCGSHMIYETL